MSWNPTGVSTTTEWRREIHSLSLYPDYGSLPTLSRQVLGATTFKGKAWTGVPAATREKCTDLMAQ